MKKEDDIKYRLKKLKQTLQSNKDFLINEETTVYEAEEIKFDIYELNVRIKMLEWVLN